MEESIAPKLKDHYGVKPETLVSYGAAHSDIAAYLENGKLPKGVLALHDKLNYSYKDEIYSDKICRIALGERDELDWIEEISYENDFYQM